MTEWKKTSCVLCAQNCGLEVQVENNRIVRVKGDKANPRSQGYVCNKGTNIAYHQHHSDRLTVPLKRTPDGFKEISWDQAISEISEKLKGIVDTHGPRSFAFMGGGGQGCQTDAAFGVTLLKGLGSRYHYSPLAQELTGYFWVCGRMFGRQNRFAMSDEHNAEMLLAVGWNGMQSHQMPRAPLVIREFSKNPDKQLVVFDPRKSETAELANVHLAVRPGTDALLFKAMIAHILQEGWEARNFLNEQVNGFEAVEHIYKDFNVKEALAVCEIDFNTIHDLCRDLTTKKWCAHPDLGIWMGRHSTATAYLIMLLSVVCGVAGQPGGNVIPGTVVPLGSHTDERDEKTWRTVETDFPALMGYHPPNVMPEEILSNKPDRLRAVLCGGSNPLRSYADTSAYEEAFEKLDLLVTVELAMTETARMSDYVLPACSGFESYDTTFFSWNFPEIFFHIRPPVVKPEGQQKECGEIYTAIAKGAGLVPELPSWLHNAAKKNRFGFTMAFLSYMMKNKKAARIAPMILAETLGKEWGSGNLAALWGVTMMMTPANRANAERAGHKIPSALSILLRPDKILRAIFGAVRYMSIAPLFALSTKVTQSDRIFQKLLDHPEGIWYGKLNPADNKKELRTEDKKLHVHLPELDEWIDGIQPASETAALEPDPNFPFILNAGRHHNKVANTLMRDPAWLKNKRGCTAAMHPDDAAALSVSDGSMVRVITESGSEELEAEITEMVRKGQVLIPHGFGLNHDGKTYGINVNRLTKNTHRDPIAATPLHRYVPCRIEVL